MYRIQDGPDASRGTQDTEGHEAQDIKWMFGNGCVCGMVMLKWLLKKLVLYLDLINIYNTEQSEVFGNVNVATI